MKLDADFMLQNVWVRGEISNFTHHSSGHFYFTLKDKDSKIKCIMFARQTSKINFVLKDGLGVIANGSVTIYERDGQYQLYISSLQPDGIGNLYLAFEQLKQKLEREGLFLHSRKRPIPSFPSTVGVITSKTGAAIRDIVTTLHRRNPATSILVYPIAVQGIHAAPSIVKAIQFMNELQTADVLIVGRGGGSLEELWSFNEETVARAIAKSKIPIISAVGHETDVTIADFVADLRAATPTAAAELAVPNQQELIKQLSHWNQRMVKAIQSILSTRIDKLTRFKRSPFFINPRMQLMMQQVSRLERYQSELHLQINTVTSKSRERLSKIDQKLREANPIIFIHQSRANIRVLHLKLAQSIQTIKTEHYHHFMLILRKLDALSPLKVMERGYSLVYGNQNKLIRSLGEVAVDDEITIRLLNGFLGCKVITMKGVQENE
jgi:exodeoxyribonuclease VII large subunit